MKKTAGNKAEAADLLGINITTLYRKIKKYEISELEYVKSDLSLFSEN